MEIVIVSKTKMSSNECVGGIVIESGQFVRLLDASGSNQPVGCDFEINQIWDIDFSARTSLTPLEFVRRKDTKIS